LLNQIAAIHGTGVAAATNSYESIATVTVGAGGSSSVSFTSIPSTYKHLQIRTIERAASNLSGDHPYIRLNNDSGNNYSWHRLNGNGTAAIAGSGSTQPQMRYGYNTADASFGSNIFSAVIIDILDYQNTNKYKTLRTLAGADNNGSGHLGLESGLWQSTTAVNRVDLFPFSGNWAQYSQFALYGIKG
jgi:hypothetical protein